MLSSKRHAIVTVVAVGMFAVLLASASSLQATVYVVDAGHPKAGDANAGSEAAPWQTIGRAVKAAKAGDTVYVMAGDYAERITLTSSGVEGKPLVFHALPQGEVTMRGFDLAGQSFVRIQGFKIISDKPSDRTPGIVVGKGGTDVEILANRFDNMYMGLSGNGANVRVAYNKFYKTQYGLLCGSESEKWVIECNDLERQFQHRRGDCDYSRMWGKHHAVRYNHYHGTKRAEIGKAHLDCVQSFNVKKDRPSVFLHHLTFERNVCTSFSQAFMMSTSTPGTHHTMTFRHNIFHTGGAWGLCLKKLPDMVAEQNTFAIIKWYGFGHAGGERGRAVNNAFFRINTPYTTGPGFVGKGNMAGECKNPPKDAPKKECLIADPKFVDPEKGNFRLSAGSPAIDAGADGKDIGGLEYPNVYYVDPRHPGASDEHFGYAGRPFKTLTKAMAVAKDAETVILRGGVYREVIVMRIPGVTVRALEGEQAVVCTSDVVTGWVRRGDSWQAPLPEKPTRLLRDGVPLNAFTYDPSAKTITVRGFDPRIHVVETVVRAKSVDHGDRKEPRVFKGVTFAETGVREGRR
jgi:Protein of unknown function (DUF1565)